MGGTGDVGEDGTMVGITNWAGNQRFTPDELHRPSSLDELRDVVVGATSLRVLGAGHSFNRIADGQEMVALDGLSQEVRVDRDAATVTCPAAMTYATLAGHLAEHDLALQNLASLPHVTVAGATATSTHGSGFGNGNLATQVAALELMTASGELVTMARGDEGFDGAVVGLGALGVVTSVTLDVEPAYDARQRVFVGLPWEALLDDLEAVMGCGYSTTVFCSWGDDAGDLWVKDRADEPEVVHDERFGAVAATEPRGPVGDELGHKMNPQMGEVGAWSDRLPHFRAGVELADPELQTEFFVPVEQAPDALRAVRAEAGRIREALLVTELRVVAADELWLSHQQGQRSLGIHFTWHDDTDAAAAAVEVLHEVFDPLEARAHWGKLMRQDAADAARRYERHADFVALVRELDPDGRFANEWLRRRVLGT